LRGRGATRRGNLRRDHESRATARRDQPIYLRHPLAPSVAAKLERKSIDLRKIIRAYQQLAKSYDVVLVEGAGGLLVPIRDNYFVADLAKTLKLPC